MTMVINPYVFEEAIAYLLETGFDNSGSPIANGVTYTDIESWLKKGSIIGRVPSGSVTVQNNRAEITVTSGFNGISSSDSGNDAQDGRILRMDGEIPNAAYVLNYVLRNNTLLSGSFIAALVWFGTGGVIRAYSGVAWQEFFQVMANVNYTGDLVADNTNGRIHFFIDGIRRYILDTSLSGTDLYAQYYSGTPGNTVYVNGAKIVDTLQPSLITPTLTLTDETEQATHANVTFYGSFTAVTGQTMQLDHRQSVTGGGGQKSSWRVKFTQGSSNNITLHKVTDDVESAALSTGSATINNGVSYDLQVTHQGTDYVKAYLSGEEVCTYTVSDTHQQSETGAQLTLGTISTVSIEAYPNEVTINA